MPARSEKQARTFRMAYAVRRGHIKKKDAPQVVKDIANGKMETSKMRDFFYTEGLVDRLRKSLNDN